MIWLTNLQDLARLLPGFYRPVRFTTLANRFVMDPKSTKTSGMLNKSKLNSTNDFLEGFKSQPKPHFETFWQSKLVIMATGGTSGSKY